MAKHWCVDGKLETRLYSFPVPIIGLYVAVASLVCFLFLLHDILSGFRRGLRYLPCRFFSLNSLTLTLLSIATKLPGDLTAAMPRAIDQLSKLTGTVMICISMGFFMPSLGVNRKSESIGNMAALSIMIVTIVVDVCIQISTGVIFSFVVEHVIILFFMLLLLLSLWISAMFINNKKEELMDANKNIFGRGGWTMLHYLKRWYMYNNLSNPQWLICKDFITPVVGMICLSCSIILLQATIQSLVSHKLKFCEGSSDYQWSIWTIIVTQNMAILAGTLATSLRWFAFIFKVDWDTASDFSYDLMEYVRLQFKCVKRKFSFISFKLFVKLIAVIMLAFLYVIAALIFALIATLPVLMFAVLVLTFKKCLWHLFRGSDTTHDTSTSQLEHKFSSIDVPPIKNTPRWIVKVFVQEMDKIEAINKSESCLTHIVQLLSISRPLQQSFISEIQSIGKGLRYNDDHCRVTCLSIVILLRLATISIPSTQSGALKQALAEAFEIIYFIDKKINVGYLDRRKRDLAKFLWLSEDIEDGFMEKSLDDKGSVDYSIKSIEKLYQKFPRGLAKIEINVMMVFIKKQECKTIEDFYNLMEQLLVDMLHVFLSQLPVAIFKEVTGSPLEENQERGRAVLKLLYKVGALEDKLQWSFPENVGITGLMVAKVNQSTSNPSSEEQLLITTSITEDVPTTGDIEIGSHV